MPETMQGKLWGGYVSELEGYLITTRHMMLGIVSVFYGLKLPQRPLPWPPSISEDPVVGSMVCPASIHELSGVQTKSHSIASPWLILLSMS